MCGLIGLIGFTLVECILSGIYVWSLLGLFNLKSSVRQCRVMLDLIYVNIIIVCLDIVFVILIYLNRLGISHPLQTFSYALKLKLEFVVLNQLMAVAACGMHRESFAERRYRHSSKADASDAECRHWDEKPNTAAPNEHRASRPDPHGSPHGHSARLSVPAPALSKLHPISESIRILQGPLRSVGSKTPRSGRTCR